MEEFDNMFTNGLTEIHWRPSYNQMTALQWAIENLASYDQVVGYLGDLFEELKRL